MCNTDILLMLIERLNGRADVRNIASNKVLERCGFIKEGTIRQGKMVSVYCDYNIYGMLKEDYARMTQKNERNNI